MAKLIEADFEDDWVERERYHRLQKAKAVVDCLKSLGDDIDDYDDLRDARRVLQALALAVLADVKECVP
jgi:hypothetical protein